VDRAGEVEQGGGAVGEGDGCRVGEAIRGEEAQEDEFARISFRARAVLAGSERARSRGGKREARGWRSTASHAAPEHVGFQRAALQHEFKWGGVLPAGSLHASGW